MYSLDRIIRGTKMHAGIAPEANSLAPVLMPAMMRRFRLGPEALVARHPGTAEAIRATCGGCAAAPACFEALQDGASMEECRRFCPISPTLQDLLCPQRAPRAG